MSLVLYNWQHVCQNVLMTLTVHVHVSQTKWHCNITKLVEKANEELSFDNGWPKFKPTALFHFLFPVSVWMMSPWILISCFPLVFHHCLTLLANVLIYPRVKVEWLGVTRDHKLVLLQAVCGIFSHLFYWSTG